MPRPLSALWRGSSSAAKPNNSVIHNHNCNQSLTSSTITHVPLWVIMADRRDDIQENGRAKRQKMSGPDPSSNPYLAHMYPGQDGEEESNGNGYSNGYSSRPKTSTNGAGSTEGLRALKRHKTTTAQANAAEDGPSNPFNGSNLSQRYFGILKTRRTLPVHQQRSVVIITWHVHG